MASLIDSQALDHPGFDDIDYDFLDLDTQMMCTLNPDLLEQASRSENPTFINDFAHNKLDSGDEYGDLTCSLAQESTLSLDGYGMEGSGDSTNLDPWGGALTSSFDLLATSPIDYSSLDPTSDLPYLSGVQWPMPLEVRMPENPSLTAVTIPPDNRYQPTPELTESSTFASNGNCESSIESISSFETESQRWHATLSRSRTADRYFLYGVLTTKIFCRPSCASRRPSRRHVQFFAFPGAIEAAEQGKFRPCKRCKPETLGTGNASVIAISQVLRKIIAETFEKRNGERKGLKLELLARSAGLSTFHFHRLFKATTQITPANFIAACYALALQDDLCTNSTRGTTPDAHVVQVSSHWSGRRARKALGGLKPAGLANGAEKKSIEYCCVSSPGGELVVAYSGDSKTSNVIVHAVVLSQDFRPPTGVHLWASKESEKYAQCLSQCVEELEEKCQDRDVELATDVLSILWRARLWLKLTHDNGLSIS